jgi:GR25 family glycosyltransferase involved in LPS biosynthesis
MNLFIVAVSTDEEKTDFLLQSCTSNGCNLNIIGLGEKWVGFGTKFRILRDWLIKREDIKDDDYIINTDAFDTVVQKNYDDIKQVVNDLDIGDKIFCSSEIYLWPPEIFEFKSFFEDLTNKKKLTGGDEYYNMEYQYPCSGQYCAKKKTVLSFLNEMYTSEILDDQEAMIRYLVSHPDLIYLDRETKLFQPNLYLLNDHHDAYINARSINKTYSDTLNPHLYIIKYKDKHIFKNKKTKNSACLLHANGTDYKRLPITMSNYIDPITNADTNRFNMMFPVIEVVTLKERKSYVEELLEGYKFNNTNIFDAVMGVDVDEQTRKKYFTPNALKNLSNGEIGCAMSHIRILEKHINNIHPWIVVFEDDFSFSNTFPSIWAGDVMKTYTDILLQNSDDWSIFYLGRCEDVCSSISFPFKSTSLVIKTKKPYCTHAYMINTRRIKDILDGILPITCPIDDSYIKASDNNNIKTYSSNPPLFYQGGFTTSIEGRDHVPSGDDRIQKLCSDKSTKSVYFSREMDALNKNNKQKYIILLVLFIIFLTLAIYTKYKVLFIIPILCIAVALVTKYKSKNQYIGTQESYMNELTEPTPSIGFIYIAYNSLENVEDCLASVREYYKTNHIILISDGGNVDFTTVCKKYGCEYLHSTENIGLKVALVDGEIRYKKWASRIVNILDRFKDEQYIIRLEDDVRCIRPIKKLDNIDVVGAFNVKNIYNKSIINKLETKGINIPTSKIYYNCGGCRIYNRKAWLHMNKTLLTDVNMIKEYHLDYDDLPVDRLLHDDWFDGLMLIHYGLTKKCSKNIYNISDKKAKTSPSWKNKKEWPDVSFIHNYKTLY